MQCFPTGDAPPPRRITAEVSHEGRRWTVHIPELGVSARARGAWQIRSLARSLVVTALELEDDDASVEIGYRFIDDLTP